MSLLLIKLKEKYKRFYSLSTYKYTLWYWALYNLFSYNDEERALKNIISYGIRNVNGDYLEFGVWKGKSFIRAYHFSKNFSTTRNNPKGRSNIKFYAFDSFMGLPNPNKVEIELFKQSEFSCSKKIFVKNIKRGGVDLKKVIIVEGWYHKVLTKELQRKLPLKKASVIYIDCDLYESTVSVLNFIIPYITTGTIIAFDDWYSFKNDPNKGEQRAFYEWLKRNPQFKAEEFYKIPGRINSFFMRVENSDGNSDNI